MSESFIIRAILSAALLRHLAKCPRLPFRKSPIYIIYTDTEKVWLRRGAVNLKYFVSFYGGRIKGKI